MKHHNIAVFVPHLGCPHDCIYCNQRVISGSERPPTAEDVASILREYERRKNLSPAKQTMSELAFFGGSFTAIERAYMGSLLEAAQPFLNAGVISGIRVSTRPDCVNDEILDVLRGYGVTAVELGAQSMDDPVLRMNRRGHTAGDVEAAGRLIKSAGFELGLQMMTGLYGSSSELDISTAARLIELNPDTARVYPVVVLRGTRLAELLQSGAYRPQTLEDAVDSCAEILGMFLRAGVRVIRVGLHASTGIEREYMAGAYHPALRELVESRRYLNMIMKTLSDHDASRGKNDASDEITLTVNPRERSKLTGQRRCNLEALSLMGITARVCVDSQVKIGDVKVEI